MVLIFKLAENLEATIQMSFQCKLNKNDFMDLCKCPLSKEAYLKKLEEMGLLE
jgi:hypothetical protein